MHYYLHAMKIFHYTLLYHNKKPKYLLRCCVTKYNRVNFDIITVSNHLRECLLYVLDVSWELLNYLQHQSNYSVKAILIFNHTLLQNVNRICKSAVTICDKGTVYHFNILYQVFESEE